MTGDDTGLASRRNRRNIESGHVTKSKKTASDFEMSVSCCNFVIKNRKDMDFSTKRLYRSNEEKMIAGVCGGIAEYFDLDPVLVRVGYILLSVFTFFSGLLAYLILWIVIPQKKD
jgi:phage shock protein PspC (stress-responsive transcriptional regulator)